MNGNLVTISKGNSKLGRLWNISLLPIVDCGNCEACKKHCYAKKIKRFPQPWKAYEKNSLLLRKNRSQFFMSIIDHLLLTPKKPEYFRIHVGGDFIDQNYLDMWCVIAKTFPETKFLAFTKMNKLNYTGCPENMKVILSQWTGARKLRAKGVKFNAWLENDKRAKGMKCNGTCDSCAMCWNEEHDVILKVH